MTRHMNDSRAARPKGSRIDADKVRDGLARRSKSRSRGETPGETRVDRRRVQLRIAQRTFRQRQEQMITSLESKNAHLKCVIDQLDQTLSRFNETVSRLEDIQADSEFKRELKEVQKTFVSLTKSAIEEEENAEEPSGKGLEVGGDFTEEFLGGTSTHQTATSITTNDPFIDSRHPSALGTIASQSTSGLLPNQSSTTMETSCPVLPSSISDSSSVPFEEPPSTVNHVSGQTELQDDEVSELLPFGLIIFMPSNPGPYSA
ncbi:hypothetical protein BU24DRAFT_448346 [Aaosphaeria arxii CBS 175.79]|uniref:BZIP domain-containing protein n=1 Tax=Aaosphaeria arxii CBS 175.79 TaxID=1450172 RepID=A0A6A5Y548_9PLEO|nr:uncharacterized protein BU24DRAFT_448346 [Aaosphaeria arxii CBS 175.79]KAF2019971.1 hypothetical protein BU24DRAFT_448346 [Aaosphaeria arxii CBS 175.79]